MILPSIFTKVNQHRIAIAFFIVLCIGIFLRFYNLSGKSFWQDEALFWQWADGLSISDFYKGRHYSVNVYIIILSFLDTNLGEGYLRIVSAISGVVAIPAFYLLARRFVLREAALAGALLLALSPTQISQSQQLREYSFTVLLAILIMYFFVLYMEKARIHDLLFFMIFSILGIFLQIGLLLVLAAMGLSALLLLRSKEEQLQRRILIGLAIYSIPILLSGLWLWRFAYSQYLGFAADSYLTLGYWDQNLSSLFRFLWNNTWFTVNYAFNSGAALFAVFLLIWGTVVLLKKKFENQFVLSLIFFPMVISILGGLSRVYPYVGSRHTIFLSVSLYILTAVSLSILFHYHRWLFSLAISLIAFSLFQTSWTLVNQSGHEEMRPIVQDLCREILPIDHIYIHPEATFAFNYYWRQCPLSQTDSHWDFDPAGINTSPFYSHPHLSASNSTKGSLWFVTSHLNESELNQFLRNVAQELGEKPAVFAEAPGAGLFLLANE